MTRSPDGWAVSSFDSDRIRRDQAGYLRGLCRAQLGFVPRCAPATEPVPVSLSLAVGPKFCLSQGPRRVSQRFWKIHHRGQRSQECICVTSSTSSWWWSARGRQQGQCGQEGASGVRCPGVTPCPSADGLGQAA